MLLSQKLWHNHDIDGRDERSQQCHRGQKQAKSFTSTPRRARRHPQLVLAQNHTSPWPGPVTFTLDRLLAIAHTLCAALLVFTLTRWPSGNVWDAVLDPWLWLLALGSVLRRLWRHR